MTKGILGVIGVVGWGAGVVGKEPLGLRVLATSCEGVVVGG